MTDVAHPSAGVSAAGRDAVWVHHSNQGIEHGSEAPTGRRTGSISAFVRACALTWELRKALWVLVLKDFKSRYRAHALGLFWSLAHPLVMMATLTIAFQYVLQVRINNFAVFFLIGSVYWQFFTNALTCGTGALSDNGGLLKTTTFPRFLFPIAGILSQLIHFAMESVIILAFFFFFPSAYSLNVTLVVLPLLVFLELTMLVGLVLITSALHARYRDLYYIVSSVLTVGFWLTPILYSTSMAPERLRPLLRLNPMGGIIEGAREIIMHGSWPSMDLLLPAIVCAPVFFFSGCAVFRRESVQVADYV
jgi:ABC-type polysaccharide/polyol phosphate export permease